MKTHQVGNFQLVTTLCTGQRTKSLSSGISRFKNRLHTHTDVCTPKHTHTLALTKRINHITLLHSLNYTCCYSVLWEFRIVSFVTGEWFNLHRLMMRGNWTFPSCQTEISVHVTEGFPLWKVWRGSTGCYNSCGSLPCLLVYRCTPELCLQWRGRERDVPSVILFPIIQ